jgi:hypothetical protein
MTVIKASALEVEKILFGKLEDSSHITSQKLAFISYKEPNNKLVVQTPEFITETYGIPREGPFYQTPKSRAFYKLPFCHERGQFAEDIDYRQVEQLYNKLQEIDKYCDTEDFRLEMFGERLAKKYEYQPLIRSPEAGEAEGDGEEVGGQHIYYRPPFTKVKLDLVHDTEQPNFKIIDRSDGGKQEVRLTSFGDVLQHMRFLTKHRMIVHFSKMYAMKTASGSEKRKYGIVLKATAVECTNKNRPAIANSEMDLFID